MNTEGTVRWIFYILLVKAYVSTFFEKHLVIGIKVLKIFITYPQYKSLKDSRKSDKSTIMYVQRCSSQHYLYQHGIMYINLAT